MKKSFLLEVLALFVLLTVVDIAHAQCEVSIQAEDVCAADWGGIFFQIIGACDDPDASFRVEVQWNGWWTCDGDNYDCSWTAELEAATLEGLSWVDVPWPSEVSPFSGADVTIQLEKVFEDGSSTTLAYAWPWVEYDHFIVPEAVCDQSIAVHDYEILGALSDPRPTLEGNTSQLEEFFFERRDDSDHKRTVTVALEPGTYGTTYQLSDCQLSDLAVSLTPHPPLPADACLTAEPLTSGVLHNEDFVCGPVSEVEFAAADQWRVQRWFTVNSQDFEFLSFGFEERNWTSTWSNSYEMRIEMYTMPEGGTCEDLTLIGTVDGRDRMCVSVGDFAAIAPNTDYLFSIWVAPTTDISVGALLSNTDFSICGCSEVASCAYAPAALFEYCPELGCTDTAACNYQSAAECDNGTCIFPQDLVLAVYHDQNYDGDMDGWEDALAGIGNVVVEQGGEVLFTVIPDASGQAIIPDLPDGSYTAYFTDPLGLWSSNGPVNFTFPTCNPVEVGAHPMPDTYDHYSSFLGQFSSEINCNDGLSFGFWALNIGAEDFDGSVTVTFDENLSASPLNVNWSSADATSATWNINNQVPGEQATYGVYFDGPNVDLIGQELDLSITVVLTQQDGTVFYEESYNTTVTVVCAYDPNDKTTIAPETYTDAGYIAPETEWMTYRIRFQNTGNAPAQDVVIEDPIDPETLDIHTLVPTFGSHPFYTVLEPDGSAKFVFENIFLPDSVSDLQGSQGEVYFDVQLQPGMSPGDVVENTAEIYFDANPPIITNTASNTLFDCAWMTADFDADFCVTSPILVAPTFTFTEDYSWQLDGLAVGEANTPYAPDSLTVDEHPITVLLSNPFCEHQPRTVWINVTTSAEDLDLNGWVDTADVLAVMGTYGCLEQCVHDLDGNGVIGMGDLLQVLAAVGSVCD